MSGLTSLVRRLQVVFPAVDPRPARTMPSGLYTYVVRVTGRHQIPLCVVTFLVFPLTLAPLQLQRLMVDEAIGGMNARLLLILAGLYFAAVLLQGALKYLRNVYLDRVAEGVTRRLRRRIVDNRQAGVEMERGTKQSMIVAESQAVGGFVAESLAFPLLQAGIVCSIAIYMLVVDFWVALVALAFFVPSVIVVAVTQPRLNKLAKRKTESQRELGELVSDDDTSSEAGPSKGHQGERQGEDAERRSSMDLVMERIYGVKVKIALLKHGLKFLNNFFGHLGPLSILAFGGWMIIQGQTTLGTVMAFVSGYTQMTDPARELLNFYRRLAMMRVQYDLVRQAATVAPAPEGG